MILYINDWDVVLTKQPLKNIVDLTCFILSWIGLIAYSNKQQNNRQKLLMEGGNFGLET